MQRNTFTNRQADPTQGRPGGFSFFRKLGALALVLVGIGASQQSYAQSSYIGDQLTIQATTTTSNTTTTYRGSTSANDTTKTTGFRGADLGSGNKFDITTGVINITVVSDTLSPYYITYVKGNPALAQGSFNSSVFYYRVYLQGSTAPQYSSSALSLTSSTNSSNPTTYAANNIDLFAVPRSTGGGTYQVDIYFESSLKKSNGNVLVDDPGSGANKPFTATFSVNAPATTPAGATTTWQGVARGLTSGGTPVALPSDTDWNNTANWTNGIPTRYSNAVIPAKSSGSKIVYPILNDATANYKVKNLTLQGNSNSSAGQLSVNAATLRVYGDINEPAGGLVGNLTNNAGLTDSTQNSTLVLAGVNQVITGNVLMSDVIIAGAGTKSIINQLIVTNIIAFKPSSVTNGVIVQSAAQDNSSGSVMTVFDTTGNSYIQLLAQSIISTVAGQAETNTSYIKGVSRADRQLNAGVKNTFGNIGLDITANHTPGNIVVYRVVGDALTGPVSNSTAVPVKRQYRIVGDNDSNNSGFTGSNFDAVFHYLDSSDELNGIMESNLTMFRTVTNGAPYQALGGVLDQTNNTVTRLAINSLSDFKLTLGDRTNPLPVTLAAFAAVRGGNNALLSWSTATEENNAGFNVQVSADGVKFRTLSFVESKSVNSVQAQNYSYTDVEAGKAGTRYYRLEQVDIDGTKSYSQVRAVSFSGSAATSLSLAASPNPFNSELTLTFDGLSTPDGTAHVRLVDMTGRLVRDQDVPLTGASIALGDLSGLRSGLYLAKVTLADGTTKTVRVQRQ